MEKFPNTRQERPPGIEDVFEDRNEAEVMLWAYKEANMILDRDSIKPEEFSDIYSQKLLEECEQYVNKREEIFNKDEITDPKLMRAEAFGKTLEGIFHHQINAGIFGENIRGVSTAKYDDYHAGIDEVIEGRNPEGTSYVGCSLDLTFGHPEHKMQQIVNSIKGGTLNEVLFYKSPFGEKPYFKGKLQGIPKVVVGMDAAHVLKLSRQWQNQDSEALKNNQIFLVLLQQIQKQAEIYSYIANLLHKKEISIRYEQLHNFINTLYTEQKRARKIDMLDRDATSDTVNQEIVAQTNKIFIDSKKLATHL